MYDCTMAPASNRRACSISTLAASGQRACLAHLVLAQAPQIQVPGQRHAQVAQPYGLAAADRLRKALRDLQPRFTAAELDLGLPTGAGRSLLRLGQPQPRTRLRQTRVIAQCLLDQAVQLRIAEALPPGIAHGGCGGAGQAQRRIGNRRRAALRAWAAWRRRISAAQQRPAQRRWPAIDNSTPTVFMRLLRIRCWRLRGW